VAGQMGAHHAGLLGIGLIAVESILLSACCQLEITCNLT
jgi:hypothetical protein